MSGLPESFAVTTHGLSMRYEKQTALAGIDLRVPEGSIYVLIGANGAGKSTAMKVLMNLERATEGRAEVFGLDTAAQGPEVRARVGYIPESQYHPYSWMTGRRLIQHVATHYPAWDHANAER